MHRHDDHRTTSVRLGRPIHRRTLLKAAATSGLATGLAALSWRYVPGPLRVDLGPGQATTDDRIADLAAELGYDLTAISEFVADAVRYEPYAGALRGPQGTLAARAGNSVDQAALLAALLDASLIPYRYAVGRLDDASASALQAGATIDASAASGQIATALQGTLPQGVQGPAGGGEAAVTAEVSANGAAVEAWVAEELQETVTLLGSALERAGLSLPMTFSELPIRERDQHLWLQVAQGADWLDLDPSRTVSGTAPGPPQLVETHDTLPDDLRHRVELAIRGESLTEAGVEEADLLRVWAYADELAGLPIAFFNTSPGGIQELAEAVTPMAGITSYVPTLVLGQEAFAGRPIRFGRPGALEDDDLLGEGSLFDAAGSTDETSAEWLEVTVASPDREPVTERRVVFDRFGAEARTEGDLDAETLQQPLQLETQEGAREMLPALTSMWLAVDVGLPSADAPALRATDETVEASAIYAQALQLLRDTGDVTFGVPLGVRSFVDAPNVAAYTVGSRPTLDGQVLVEAGLDILHRSRGTLPVDSQHATMSPAAVAGVLDHVVERALGGEAPGVTGPEDTNPASVGAVFRAALEEGVDFTVLRQVADAEQLGYPARANALLAADLRDGWVAVAPEQAVTLGPEERLGWWLVDPVSGRTVDRLDDGRGSNSIGYAATLTPGQLARQTLMKELAQKCLLGTAAAFAAVLSVAVAGLAGSEGYGWGAAALAASGASNAAIASHYAGFCVKTALL